MISTSWIFVFDTQQKFVSVFLEQKQKLRDDVLFSRVVLQRVLVGFHNKKKSNQASRNHMCVIKICVRCNCHQNLLPYSSIFYDMTTFSLLLFSHSSIDLFFFVLFVQMVRGICRLALLTIRASTLPNNQRPADHDYRRPTTDRHRLHHPSLEFLLHPHLPLLVAIITPVIASSLTASHRRDINRPHPLPVSLRFHSYEIHDKQFSKCKILYRNDDDDVIVYLFAMGRNLWGGGLGCRSVSLCVLHFLLE